MRPRKQPKAKPQHGQKEERGRGSTRGPGQARAQGKEPSGRGKKANETRPLLPISLTPSPTRSVAGIGSGAEAWSLSEPREAGASRSGGPTQASAGAARRQARTLSRMQSINLESALDLQQAECEIQRALRTSGKMPADSFRPADPVFKVKRLGFQPNLHKLLHRKRTRSPATTLCARYADDPSHLPRCTGDRRLDTAWQDLLDRSVSEALESTRPEAGERQSLLSSPRSACPARARTHTSFSHGANSPRHTLTCEASTQSRRTRGTPQALYPRRDWAFGTASAARRQRAPNGILLRHPRTFPGSR